MRFVLEKDAVILAYTAGEKWKVSGQLWISIWMNLITSSASQEY
jgi:hypothetical protein